MGMSCLNRKLTLLLAIVIMFAMVLQETSQMYPSCHGNDANCPSGQKCFRPYAGADWNCVYKCSGRMMNARNHIRRVIAMRVSQGKSLQIVNVWEITFI